MVRRRKLKSQKGFLEKWQVKLTFVATIFTLAGFLLDVPKKITDMVNSVGSATERKQVLAGILSDADGHMLDGIIVMLTDYSLADTTDATGSYYFQVQDAPKEESVQLLFMYNGKMLDKGEATLGKTANNRTLRIKP